MKSQKKLLNRIHRSCILTVFSACVLPSGIMAPAMAETTLFPQVSTHDMGNEKDVTAEAWSDFVASLQSLRDEAKTRAPDERGAEYLADLDQLMLMVLTQGALVITQQDPKHPDWVPYINNSIPIAAPNPDTIYYVARIDADGSYLITGERNTVRLIDLQVAHGLWGLVDKPGPTLDNIDIDQLVIDEDGSFELLLSPERPPNYAGNWIKLNSQADHLFVRQVAYDWLTEQDARIAIQRVDRPIDKERRTSIQTKQHLENFVDFMRRQLLFFQGRYVEKLKQETNTLSLIVGQKHEALNQRQAYYQGRIHIPPGKALILETAVPENCRYWGLQVYDSWLNSIDYMYRQSSLNGHTANLDEDGKLRVVLSTEDVGVSNWIDLSGYEDSFILGRWYECDSAPLPTLQEVRIEEVVAALPSDTAMVTPSERQNQLARRAKGAQMRRRW